MEGEFLKHNDNDGNVMTMDEAPQVRACHSCILRQYSMLGIEPHARWEECLLRSFGTSLFLSIPTPRLVLQLTTIDCPLWHCWQAFSHFTWDLSSHRLVICDIQGVGEHFTDPQIHSEDGISFGVGNLGQVVSCQRTHRTV